MPQLAPFRIPLVDPTAIRDGAEVEAAVRVLQKQDAKWLPIIRKDRCTSCDRCIEACGFGCLEKIDGTVVVASPNTCGSAAACVLTCRDEAIEMAWVIFSGDRDIGRWRTEAEREGPAVRCRPEVAVASV